MSTVLFTRGPRRAGPVAPAEDTELQEPPVVPEPANSGIGSVLMYAPLGLGSLAMMMMFIRPNAGAVAYLGFGLMLVSVLFTSLGRARSVALSPRTKRSLTGAGVRCWLRSSIVRIRFLPARNKARDHSPT